eukprot:gene922-4183_t
MAAAECRMRCCCEGCVLCVGDVRLSSSHCCRCSVRCVAAPAVNCRGLCDYSVRYSVECVEVCLLQHMVECAVCSIECERGEAYRPSHKSFRIKMKLAKAARRNRPLPQWVRLKTDSKIRYNAKRRRWRQTKLNF